MKKEMILGCMILLVGIMAVGLVSAADYKFQDTSENDLMIIHGDTANVSITGNISATAGFFSWLGSLTDRITKLFVQDIDFSGNINGSGWINTTANVSADYYYGDGSKLTGIGGGLWRTDGRIVYNLTANVSIGTATSDYRFQTIGRVNLSNALFVNGTNGYVGIGTASPSQKLEVNGNVKLGTSDNLYLGNDARFYGDGTYMRYLGPDPFYITNAVATTYVYSDAIYLGYTSGDVIQLRGNIMTGNLFRFEGASGSLRLGSTADPGAYELYVTGQAYVSGDFDAPANTLSFCVEVTCADGAACYCPANKIVYAVHDKGYDEYNILCCQL